MAPRGRQLTGAVTRPARRAKTVRPGLRELSPPALAPQDLLLADLTPAQQCAVRHEGGPLLIIAGAGTGKTTVITRRIAWLMRDKQVRPDQILALTFTDKAAVQMEERVDLLAPYGYLNIALKTFHAFGDQLLREHAIQLGLTQNFRVLSQQEQRIFLSQHMFELPLAEYRPLNDPTRYVDALIALFSRAKDEAVSPDEFAVHAKQVHDQARAAPADEELQRQSRRLHELAAVYAAYQALLRSEDVVDFGDQMLLAIQLLEQHPEVLAALRRQYQWILVDEFQDTNYAQFRLLQLFTDAQSEITVVADDDQSIYKWRGAAISNVLKFLERYPTVQTIVLTDNFRSSQAILDTAYRLIRFNDPDRLEVRQGIEKRLLARVPRQSIVPKFQVFDDASSESDWVATTIRTTIEAGRRRPSDFAILVRSNRDADLFLRALNVAGVSWRFSGASGLFARHESKMLVSCLKSLTDPADSLSWYHVASSPLYNCPMDDLTAVLAEARRTHRSLQELVQQLDEHPTLSTAVSDPGKQILRQLGEDVQRLLELSRHHSGGQVLFRWLQDRGFLTHLSRCDDVKTSLQLQTVARFFNELRRVEELVGPHLPALVGQLELFEAMGNQPFEEDDAWADRVNVLTIHKAKGLEFPVVFLVRLVHGRFPTPQRRDTLELPESLVKDLLPSGDYHLQEERRLFYVGMTRAKEELFLTAAYDYGGKTARKVSQFVLESLNLSTQTPPAKRAGATDILERSQIRAPLAVTIAPTGSTALRLDAHGLDDYLTCPMKYRYSKILRIPAMRHHVVIYGAALHSAIEQFFKRQLQGMAMREAELLVAFEQAWVSEGFLTREHEQLRLEQGRQTLRRFYAAQQATPEHPTLIEEKFRFALDDLFVTGRWDRVDLQGDDAIIIDYKSSDIRDQAAADRRTRESLQLLVYALAWQTLHGRLPSRVELRFLETGLTGQAHPTDDDMDRTRQLLRTAARGIRSQDFHPKPNEFACQWCAYQSICPAAFQSK